MDVPKRLKTKINNISDIAKIDKKLSGNIPFTVIFNTLDNRCFRIHAYFENEKKKMEDLRHIHILLYFLGAKRYFLISESWGMPEDEKEPNKEVRLHFRKKSVITVIYVSKKYKLSKSLEVKKIDGEFQYEDLGDFGSVAGRMTEFINFEKYKDNTGRDDIVSKFAGTGLDANDVESWFIENIQKHSTLKVVELPKVVANVVFDEKDE